MNEFSTNTPIGLEDERDFEESLVEDVDGQTLHAEIIPEEERSATTVHSHLDVPDNDSSVDDASTFIKSKSGDSTLAGRPRWAGKRMSHFRLLRLLGEGAMGRVIEAVDIHLNRRVALKVLRKRIKGMDETVKTQQFLREAQAAAKIDHPNVVRIFEIGQHEGWWFIAMELIEGETLKEIVKVAGPVPAIQACNIAADAASALAVAHSHGIIHRDVKPGNLMFTRDGRCKLTDFGLVHVNDPDNPFAMDDRSVGTPQYLAPEIIKRQEQSSAIDMYSLGCTIYFAMTGKAAFPAKKLEELLEKHVKDPPPDVRAILPQVPESVSTLLQKLMAKKPSERPTAQQAAAMFRREIVGTRSTDSGAWQTLDGSGSMTVSAEEMSRIGGGRFEQTGSLVLPSRPHKRSFMPIVVFLGLLAIAAAVFFGQNPNFFKRSGDPKKVEPTASLDELFPKAPPTYGVRPIGELPRPSSQAAGPPAFSWVGQIDPGSAKFVASRSGQHYYEIDDPRAKWIRVELFVAYDTVQEAVADGKQSAP